MHPCITLDLTTRAEPFMFTDTHFDAAIHYGDPVWPGAITEYLFGEDMVPVCSPALMNGKKRIEPAELEQLPLLHQSARPDAWRDWFAVAGLSNVNAMGGSRYELFSMLVEAAKAGLGVTLVPHFFVLNELASGELVTPCSHVLHSQRSYYLVYPENKVGSASLQVFCKWLREQASTYRETILENAETSSG
jgi:DNA-binding transcriptional LysR family regulator